MASIAATEPLLAIDEPVDLLLHPRGGNPGGDELLRLGRARRGARARGRVGLRQVDGGAGGDARPRQDRADRRRLDPLQGARAHHHAGRRAARDPRLGDRDDLPGADGEPQPGDEGRPAAHGSADDPRGRQRGGRPRAGAAGGGGGAAARPEADPRQLSAPALGRPAAAHRHRHGADVEAVAPDPRRADDRARRDRRGRDRRSGEGPRARVRHLDALHQPQPRAGAGDLRPDLRDVFRRGGGDRADRRGLRRDAPSLHPGALPLDPAARRRQDAPAADRRFRATSPCPTSGRRAATSGRAAATSSRAAATRRKSRWSR